MLSVNKNWVSYRNVCNGVCRTMDRVLDGLTFIFFEECQFTQSWFYLRQRPQQLGRELARLGHRVVYVEPPELCDTSHMECKQVGDGFVQIGFQIREPKEIKVHLRELHRRFPDSVWIVNHPNWTPRVSGEIPDGCLLIYDCMDLWTEFSNSNASVGLWEMRIASVSDFVMASSMPLVNRMKLFNRQVAYVSNAVCVQDYCPPLVEALDLKSIPHPRIVFVGSIAEWVDLELVEKIADFHPNWSVVVVGPSLIPESQLPKRPNLYWLGKRPYYELSAYVTYCDVGIIPFKRTKLTRAVNPLKVHEFMASGLPVVSSFMPDLLLLQGEHVKVGGNHEEFMKALEGVLNSQSDCSNKLPLNKECTGTWKEKAEMVVRLVQNHLFSNAFTSHSYDEYGSVLREAYQKAPFPDTLEELLLAFYVNHDFASILEIGVQESVLFGCALARTEQFDEVRKWLAEYNGRADDSLSLLLSSLDDTGAFAYVLQLNGEIMDSLTLLDNASSQIGCRVLTARAWYYLGFVETSLSVYEEILDQMPGILQGIDYVFLGDMMQEMERYIDAENAYLHAAEYQSSSAVSVQRLGDLYLERAMRS